jgi:hypothetical protein
MIPKNTDLLDQLSDTLEVCRITTLDTMPTLLITSRQALEKVTPFFRWACLFTGDEDPGNDLIIGLSGHGASFHGFSMVIDPGCSIPLSRMMASTLFHHGARKVDLGYPLMEIFHVSKRRLKMALAPESATIRFEN